MKQCLCLLISYFLIQPVFAHQDTLQNKKDSLLTIQLELQQKMVKQLFEERLADSIKKADLQKQLSTADNLQKNDLLKKLETLRQKDSLRHINQKRQIDSLRAFVMSNHTINYSSDAPVNGLIVHTTVTIGYDVPWRDVHQLLIDSALVTPMIEAEPKPYVLQTSLDDFYVSYRINAFTKEPNRQAAIYSALHANIQYHFNKAGVEIMSPHYKALRDGNATTVPSDYLPNDYKAPKFVVEEQKLTDNKN